jgi:imidazolonepropionase-like amidohydrolase
MEREDETKTSAVHFLRFELTPAMAAAVKQGAKLALGTDHPEYGYQVEAAPQVRDSLARDLAD